jgi:hypothetical protein
MDIDEASFIETYEEIIPGINLTTFVFYNTTTRDLNLPKNASNMLIKSATDGQNTLCDFWEEYQQDEPIILEPNEYFYITSKQFIRLYEFLFCFRSWHK